MSVSLTGLELGTRNCTLFIFLSSAASSTGHTVGIKQMVLQWTVLGRGFWELEIALGGHSLTDPLQLFPPWGDIQMAHVAESQPYKTRHLILLKGKI